jgi:hypothetical protein
MSAEPDIILLDDTEGVDDEANAPVLSLNDNFPNLYIIFTKIT